ncbi:MBL fold metallo-hydrolase [Streptomyces sp. NBC_00425]|uniref:MBL fold metallo-hydrolase n=1 Tax=Streptomyces sp. NBC_00425 TaxID=2975740 RepID=UPI002E1F7EF2
MIVPNGATLHVIEREPEALPFVGQLLQRWMALEFDTQQCRRAVEELFRHPAFPVDESLLDARAVTDGGIVATEALLHPSADYAFRLRLFRENGSAEQVTTRFDTSMAVDVASVLRSLTGDPESVPDLSWLPRTFCALLTHGDSVPMPGFPRIEGPGIYRREHGCVVIRSRTTSVLLDPVSFWMPQAPRDPIAVEGGIDAVFITHGHADHYSVPSVLAHADPARTTVVVPPVPRTSLLAPNDMLRSLRLFGLNAHAPEWGSSIVIGDIHVDVLPFFGEQPVREGQAPHPDLRNWGSCYRFSTPDFTAVSLIDSGVDPLGDMADVVRSSRDDHGPVDFFLSSLPRFHCPFFFGLPHYYLALPFDRLRELFTQFRMGRLPSVTPGPDGIVDVCRAGRPRYYLPYGNGLEGVGKRIGDVGMSMGEPPEWELVSYLTDRFQGEGIPTRAIGWNPGDWISVDRGRADRMVYERASRSAEKSYSLS